MSNLMLRALRSGIVEIAQAHGQRQLRSYSRITSLCRPTSSPHRQHVHHPHAFSTSTPRPSTTSPSANSSSPPSEKLPPMPTAPLSSNKSTSESVTPKSTPSDISKGLSDEPLDLSSSTSDSAEQVDWTRSYHGLSSAPFSKEAAEILMAAIPMDDVEVKPDGIIYLPEIKYRRILNRAFGPGGWGLAPRGETIVTGKSITREYALVVGGRLVSIARGEQDYFSPEGIPTATEGCKSNALMRCCKDLGVASELWDPRYIRVFMKEKAKQIWVEHVPTKKKKQIWLRRDDEVRYPYVVSKFGA